MLTATGLAIRILVTMAVLECIPCSIGADDLILAPGMTVQFTCTGPGLPTWHVNRRVAVMDENCYRLAIRRAARTNFTTAMLTISGNHTCDTFNIYCGIVVSESQLLYPRNILQFSLIFQGHLLAPENLHINESVASSKIASVIEWTPPYTAVSNGNISVDPHITQYTVYITDSYNTGDVVKANVTDTQFTFNNQDNILCPVYQVSAWNAGGEGQLSEPVQESTPQVPRNVLVGSITVRGTVTTNVVHIRINNVDVVCTSRIPQFFIITLITSTGNISNETRQHQPGQAVAEFTIRLRPSVDMCSLHVRISAGNSAGISAPSGPVVVDCPHDSTDSTTTASATTVLTATSTGSGSEGNSQQGSSTTLIVTITIGVIAAVGVTLAVGIVCCLKHKSKNSKVKHSNQTDNNYTESPPLGGPVPLYKPPVAEAVYVTTEQTTSRPVATDPAIQMDTLDSTPSTLQTSVAMVPKVQTQTTSYSPTSSTSTISEGSEDRLLPPSPQVPASRPSLVYAQVNVQQTQVPPPANDDCVQYAQLKQQDKM